MLYYYYQINNVLILTDNRFLLRDRTAKIINSDGSVVCSYSTTTLESLVGRTIGLQQINNE